MVFQIIQAIYVLTDPAILILKIFQDGFVLSQFSDSLLLGYFTCLVCRLKRAQIDIGFAILFNDIFYIHICNRIQFFFIMIINFWLVLNVGFYLSYYYDLLILNGLLLCALHLVRSAVGSGAAGAFAGQDQAILMT